MLDFESTFKQLVKFRIENSTACQILSQPFNNPSVIESKTSKVSGFDIFFSEKKIVRKLAFQKSFFSVVVSTFFRKNWFWDRYLWWKTFCFELKIFSSRSKFVRKIAVEKSVFRVSFYPKSSNVGVSMLSWKALFWEKKFWKKNNFWIRIFEKLQTLNQFFQKRQILDQHI